jgi:predicted TIM-barrel fold metal-dependent hydrolase
MDSRDQEETMPDRPPVIDADGHLLERQSDIRKYLPEPWNRRNTPLFPSDQPWDSDLFDTLGSRWYSRNASPEEQVELWHQVMDEHGMELAVLFPTGSGNIAKLREPGWQIALARAANDHFAQEYNARSNRIKAVGVLPMGHPDEAAKELRRAVTELGLISFEILSMGLPFGLGDAIYDPIWATAEELGVPMCIHGNRSASAEVGADRFRTFGETHCYTFPAGMMLHFTSIMWNAVPLRFPKLKLAFLEIGATWLPYYLDRLDEHWEMRGEFEAPHLTKKPSQVFRESPMYVSLEAAEGLLAAAVDYVGDDHFLYASDIPHWDNEFPKNLEELWARPDLSADTKEKILHRNARALFGLGVPATA